MKRINIFVVSTLVLILTLTACGTATPTPGALTIRPTDTPPVQLTETAVPAPTIPAPTETPASGLTVFHDEVVGFTFDYPTGWMAEVVPSGDRADVMYQITSWSHDPGLISNIPAGETDINILVQRWDPKGDLKAFVDMRKQAWNASGITIEKAEELTLRNENPAQSFIVKGSDGAAGYFLFTKLGEKYLVVSGSGDLEQIDIVARSIR